MKTLKQLLINEAQTKRLSNNVDVKKLKDGGIVLYTKKGRIRLNKKETELLIEFLTD